MINKTPALALCLLSLCLATMGQERATRQLIVPLADGGFVAFKSETAWADTKRASASAQELRGEFGSQALVDENHVVHRVLMDGFPIVPEWPRSGYLCLCYPRRDQRLEAL